MMDVPSFDKSQLIITSNFEEGMAATKAYKNFILIAADPIEPNEVKFFVSRRYLRAKSSLFPATSPNQKMTELCWNKGTKQLGPDWFPNQDYILDRDLGVANFTISLPRKHATEKDSVYEADISEWKVKIEDGVLEIFIPVSAPKKTALIQNN